MSTKRPPRHVQYWDYREASCMMKPKSLAVLKGILISIIMMIPVMVSIVEAEGQILVGVFILAVLLAMGIEIKEIEIGNWFYAQFPVEEREEEEDERSDVEANREAAEGMETPDGFEVVAVENDDDD